jgi:hypothetical protein
MPQARLDYYCSGGEANLWASLHGVSASHHYDLVLHRTSGRVHWHTKTLCHTLRSSPAAASHAICVPALCG